jgi:hypothetical protein
LILPAIGKHDCKLLPGEENMPEERVTNYYHIGDEVFIFHYSFSGRSTFSNIKNYVEMCRCIVDSIKPIRNNSNDITEIEYSLICDESIGDWAEKGKLCTKKQPFVHATVEDAMKWLAQCTADMIKQLQTDYETRQNQPDPAPEPDHSTGSADYDALN